MNKNLITMIVSLVLVCAALTADGSVKLNLGANLGIMKPDNDKLIEQSFSRNFYLNGSMGFEADNGLELNVGIGHYADLSHFPADVGTGMKIGVTPLTVSLLFHTLPGFWLHPYVGGGVGVYFYEFASTEFGQLSSGTKFGSHIALGIKLNFTDNFYLDIHGEHHFIPPFDYGHSMNFDSSIFTVGVGIIGDSDGYKSRAYKYSEKEEAILVEIDQLNVEIKAMKQKRTEKEKLIDDFYNSNKLDEKSAEFDLQFNKVKNQERKVEKLDLKIAEAQSNLNALHKQLGVLQVEKQPVQEQIVYIQNNYAHSPSGLHNNDGFLTYGDSRDVYHDYRNTYSAVETLEPSSPAAVVAPSAATDDKADYAQKKKEYLLSLKNRTAR